MGNNASSTTGIENVGGAIEGWMRKMAGKAASAIGTPELRGRRVGVGVGAGAGDLIELVDSFELDAGPLDKGGGEGEGERERGLSERFPPRGRVFEEEGRRR